MGRGLGSTTRRRSPSGAMVELMSANWASRASRLNRNPRGLSTVVSAVLIVVVLALVGVGTYGLLGGFGNNSPPPTCWPPSAFACGKFINSHDVTILLP